MWDAGWIQVTVSSRVQTTAEHLPQQHAQTKPDKRVTCMQLYRTEMNVIQAMTVITGSVLERRLAIAHQLVDHGKLAYIRSSSQTDINTVIY